MKEKNLNEQNIELFAIRIELYGLCRSTVTLYTGTRGFKKPQIVRYPFLYYLPFLVRCKKKTKVGDPICSDLSAVHIPVLQPGRGQGQRTDPCGGLCHS